MKIQAIQPWVSQCSFRAASYDLFTGLKDKVTLLSDLQAQMKAKKVISVAMFDMDNFKSVNEVLGYKTGDKFIQAIGLDISKVARERKASAYRFGGDEFVILLLNNMPDDEKSSLLAKVQETIANDEILLSQKEEYSRNMRHLVKKFEDSQHKANEVDKINGKYEVYQDIFENSTIAKQDPYVLKSMFIINTQRENLFSRVYNETSSGTTQSRLAEYKEKYDKSHDLYRVRKWYSDFQKHGFRISGGIVTFTPIQYRGKEPIDLINETGEVLKQNKITKIN